MRFFWESSESLVGKGENAGYQHVLFFNNVFESFLQSVLSPYNIILGLDDREEEVLLTTFSEKKKEKCCKRLVTSIFFFSKMFSSFYKIKDAQSAD